MYQIAFFNKNVEEQIKSWPQGILADFIKITELMMKRGANLGKPKTDSIRGVKGLFEIRAKGKEGIGRAFFCTMKGKKIVILHGFIKKSQKTPSKEIDIAKERLKEV